MRAVALHADVLVFTSSLLQLNCLAVRAPAGEECFLIDSPLLPEELDSLPGLLGQAGFSPPNGLLATHGDWDHLLGRLAFPGLALGCAASTAERLRAAPGEAQRQLRSFDEELMIERERPLALGSVQALPVPGRCAVGSRELELLPAEGHTGDGMAVLIPWAGVLAAGDYLSAAELPALDDGACLERYLATLERLCGLLPRVEHVVPGHGPVLDRERALALAQEDRAYLASVRDIGARAELPAGRATPAQRRRHAENLQQVVGS